MDVVPGALESVETAHATGRPLAVASSSAQIHLDSKIDRYGFAPLFSGHVYSADHVSEGKPAPDIFLYAAEKLGVSSSECLVIEDSAHGVRAGVAAGATVWGFLGGGHILDDHAEQLLAAGATRLIADHEMLSQSIRVL
ncbi:MAG: HAD-IA family hydrolase, partial [Pseudomonadota bacterium]